MTPAIWGEKSERVAIPCGRERDPAANRDDSTSKILRFNDLRIFEMARFHLRVGGEPGVVGRPRGKLEDRERPRRHGMGYR